MIYLDKEKQPKKWKELEKIKKVLSKECPKCNHDTEINIWISPFGDMSIKYFCPKCEWKSYEI